MYSSSGFNSVLQIKIFVGFISLKYKHCSTIVLYRSFLSGIFFFSPFINLSTISIRNPPLPEQGSNTFFGTVQNLEGILSSISCRNLYGVVISAFFFFSNSCGIRYLSTKDDNCFVLYLFFRNNSFTVRMIWLVSISSLIYFMYIFISVSNNFKLKFLFHQIFNCSVKIQYSFSFDLI